MQQPVRCSPSKTLSAHVQAQLECHLGEIQAVFTRLDSVTATRQFAKERYFHSYEFKGSAGEHCGSEPWNLKGYWEDGAGTRQGLWTFRRSGADVVMLWEYESHRILIRASAPKVAQLCSLWFQHAGETP
jgi:hypothetical protein